MPFNAVQLDLLSPVKWQQAGRQASTTRKPPSHGKEKGEKSPRADLSSISAPGTWHGLFFF